jgi:hypothetical protein
VHGALKVFITSSEVIVMPIPANNRFFQNFFTGYKIHGRHDCQPSVLYDEAPVIFTALRGNNIAVLDDPTFDPITGRPRDNGLIDPYDTTQFEIGNTKGIEGTILECRNVNISANNTLWFTCAFLPFESHTSGAFNNFAIFAAYLQSDLNIDESFDQVQPFHTIELGQSLNVTDSSRHNVAWETFSWRPPHDFSGTLCWIVSTGKFIATNQETYPSMLLLDIIEIA